MRVTDDCVVEEFRALAAEHARCFWLDGAAEGDWSGRRSYLGWLSDDDVSLVCDAQAGVVRRHCGGRVEEVGSDVFDVLTGEIARGRPMPRASDTPATRPVRAWARRPAATYPTRCGCGPRPSGSSRTRLREINLTYRVERDLTVDPADTYLRLRYRNPAPYAGFQQHDVPGARAWLLSSSAGRFMIVRSLTTDGSGRWSLGTGGGITVHSGVDSELAESRLRANHLLDVLDRSGEEIPSTATSTAPDNELEISA